MSRIGSAGLLLLLAGPIAFAQPVTSLEQIPALDRGAPDFYGAIVGAGPRVQIEWKIAPASVERTGHVVLTLVISNAANPDELKRPPLADSPDFRERFESIETMPDLRDAKRVEFRYRLRPRNEGSFELPLPKYRYYVPQLPEGRRFQLAAANALKLTVTPPVATKAELVPLSAPEEFFQRPAWWHEADTAHEGIDPLWLGILLTPLILTVPAILAYRRLFPDAAKRAELLRRSEVRKVLRVLAHSNDAAEVDHALREYLHKRWGLAVPGRTAEELAESFGTTIVGASFRLELQHLLERCDALRYGAPGGPIPTEPARAWVLAVEAKSP